MRRCLQLAELGKENVAPNPMVGCVIVYNNTIIGEGYHQLYGEAHAEVNALQAVKDKHLLKNATLYVNLEPCNHFGKTPPCADLLVHHQLKNVVIGCTDSHSKVNGEGIKKLQQAGINVLVGVLENECKTLNKRFFTFHEKKRPYIILKWAQSTDGFISKPPAEITKRENNWLSGEASKILVHQMRACEQAILIGKNTALIDNPELTTRLVKGKNPLRIVIDPSASLPLNLNIFSSSAPTLVINTNKSQTQNNVEWIKTKGLNFPNEIATILHQKNITSLIIEGGTKTLQSFIDENLWDEALVIVANKKFNNGVTAPKINTDETRVEKIENDYIYHFTNATTSN